ncbi:BatA domain-containing protein [Paracoccus alkenifer]|uniref:N-terminal double-transmembrane domain-containing protein n=1 Tax=Paracoccus alkenifer TaxID=65735 RepID=A0A1H6LFM9_9RHOB|nr:N-terminal double-transmembrane domain-containing protein [Paracoccus alkenifer]
MMALGPLGFAAPWLLAAGLALPLLWLLLRAVPPAPREVEFPGTALLLGLADPAPVTRHTPWWLLALRLLAVAAAIIAFAGPVWRPQPQAAGDDDGPLLIVMDTGWAAAPGWAEAQARARAALDRAQAQGRPVALFLADGQGGRGQGLVFGTAADAAATLRAASPQPWETRYPADPAAMLADAPARFSTLWIADGLDHPGRAPLLASLAARGAVTVALPSAPLHSLSVQDGARPSLILRTTAPGALPPGALPDVLAMGPDPQGIPRQLARLRAAPDSDPATATISIDLPPELRNRITSFAVEGVASAGAVVLADDRMRRRKLALVGDARATEGQHLLSPLHYLRQALAPSTDLIEGTLADVLQASPDVVVLADAAPGAQAHELAEWVAQGGLLLRFAGPRMAAQPDLSQDGLLPVRLRPGGRDAGGALSWGAPRALAPFAADGIFAGLAIPADVLVRAQLLPEPDPDLAARTIAQLEDGTPLVTRDSVGAGRILLVHTTANAEWGNLALSGLFVAMLERIVQSASGVEGAERAETAPADTGHWAAELVLDGFGRPRAPEGLAPVAAEDFAQGPGPLAPAGIYASGERRAALNAGGAMVRADWQGATVEAADAAPGTQLGGWLLALAGLALAVDALGSALVAGGRRARAAA